MSEVVEVEPRAQQYHQNIKYEFRMLVKREDIVFATEDPQERKAWVAALTAIMGKVSLASQSELKNRVSNAESMTRDLQNVASELELECAELHRQLEEQAEDYMVKERKLREQWNNKEKALKRELEDSQRAFQTRTELLERELGIWKGKSSEFEKRNEMMQMKRTSEGQYKLEQAEEEARKWKTKATDLEATNELLLRQYHRAESLVAQSKVEGLRMDGKMSLEQAAIKDAVNEMRLDLSKLSHQVQSSDTEGGPLDRRVGEIQDEIVKLNSAMIDARKGYEDIHENITKLLHLDSESTIKDISPDEGLLKDIQQQIGELKAELVGSHSVGDDQDKVDSAVDVSSTGLSISSKFDALMQLVETLHNKKSEVDTSRNQEMSTILESIQQAANREASLVEDMQKSSEKAFQDINNKYESLSELMIQTQGNSTRAISHLEATLKDARDNHTSIKVDDLEKIYRKVRDSQAQISDVLASELQKLGEHECRRADEQEKSLSVLSQLFQHVANQIDTSAIPDLPDYVRQMDEMLDRLSETELRLTELAQLGSMSNASMSPRDKNSGPLANLTHIPSAQSNEIIQLLHNTRSFMERTLRVLDKFGGSAHGFEQIIKTAIKQAMPASETYNIAKKSNDVSPILDEKLKRYEDNARSYLDKSMEGMRNHLEDYTGVMYKMIEDLVLRAMEHLDSSREKDSYSSYTPSSKAINTEQLNSLIDMQSKLSANKQILEADIKRMLEEKNSLSAEIRQLQAEMKDMQLQIIEGKAEWRSLQRSSEHINQTLSRLQDMGPLIKQIERLQMLTETMPRSDNDSEGEGNSSEEYVNVDRDQVRKECVAMQSSLVL
jgi:DNA repair exonuclease SbcCD ATPase subunit